MNFQNSKLAYMVVGGQLVLAVICVGSLCLTLFYKNYSDPVVLTALIGFTGILVGNLGSILGGPRMMQSGTTENPIKAQITNPPSDPVPVEPQPKHTEPSVNNLTT